LYTKLRGVFILKKFFYAIPILAIFFTMGHNTFTSEHNKITLENTQNEKIVKEVDFDYYDTKLLQESVIDHDADVIKKYLSDDEYGGLYFEGQNLIILSLGNSKNITKANKSTNKINEILKNNTLSNNTIKIIPSEFSLKNLNDSIKNISENYSYEDNVILLLDDIMNNKVTVGINKNIGNENSKEYIELTNKIIGSLETILDNNNVNNIVEFKLIEPFTAESFWGIERETKK
jgi:hypothetical protein